MVIVVVADGVGGISGGAMAAELLVRLVEQAILAPDFTPRRAGAWIELLTRADLALESDLHAGETTGIVLAVHERGLVGASCGDSGAWQIGDDGSIDDLTAAQHRKLRLGSGKARPVGFSRPSLARALVVATDGLFSYARPSALAERVLDADLESAVNALVKLVRLPSGGLQDDVGVVLIRGVG